MLSYHWMLLNLKNWAFKKNNIFLQNISQLYLPVMLQPLAVSHRGKVPPPTLEMARVIMIKLLYLNTNSSPRDVICLPCSKARSDGGAGVGVEMQSNHNRGQRPAVAKNTHRRA